MAEIPKSCDTYADDSKIQKINGNQHVNDHHDEDDLETYAYAGEIAEIVVFPMVMQTAIELDLLGIIARAGPNRQLSAVEIAAEIPGVVNPDAPVMLNRMLFLLATHSVVTCTTVDGGSGGGVERKYGLAPVAKYFVPNEDGVSLAPVIQLIQDRAFLASWSKLKEAVLEGGIPFNKVHGMDAFEYQGKDPKFNEVFNNAMLSQSTYIIKKIVKRYNGFENVQKLVDVGGGLGHTLRVITSTYPSIKGINFDLPHVIQQAPPIPGIFPHIYTHISMAPREEPLSAVGLRVDHRFLSDVYAHLPLTVVSIFLSRCLLRKRMEGCRDDNGQALNIAT